jgi:hypothetical protein
MRSGGPVTVTAAIANPSPDLTAENAEVALNLPLGVELVSGGQTQPLGTLQPRGSQGDTATASWTVRGTTDGIKQLIATTTASRYGSVFRASATGTFTVDAAPPVVELAAPSGRLTSTTIPLAWGASEPASFDLDVAVDGGTFAPWLTGTAQTSATYAAARGHGYVFRIRGIDRLGNTSAYVTSPQIAVPDATGPPPDGSPPTTDNRGVSLSPELKITRVRRRGVRLYVRGTVARGANGKLTAVWVGTARGRRRIARASTYAQLRAFALTVKIPRAATRSRLTVTYVRDRHFATQSIRLSLRSR